MAAIDVQEMVEEINRLPSKPCLKRITNGEYHKLSSEQYDVIQKISKAHIESFNFMINEGLPKGVRMIHPLEMVLPNNDKLTVKVLDIVVGKPRVPRDCVSANKILFPSECRMRGTSYRAKVEVAFAVSINGSIVETINESVGEIPIMLKSNRCNLAGLTPKQLVAVKEDAEEFGGYFIQNGQEKIIRLLTAQRRNYPLALARNSWRESGQLFSEYGISIRCVRENQIGSNMVLHYLNNGTARLKVFYSRKPFFFPIVMILKGLLDVSDQYIYERMTRGMESDSFYCSCCVNMLSLLKGDPLNEGQGSVSLRSRDDVLTFIGKRFRVFTEAAEWATDIEIANDLLNSSVAVHLKDNGDKFNLIIMMLRKLFTIAKGKAALENADNPMFHEVFPSGHIYFTLLLERIGMMLLALKPELLRRVTKTSVGGTAARASGFSFATAVSAAMIRNTITSKFTMIPSAMNMLISTGNLMSKTGLGLQQTSGICVMAEKINFWRFMSHFRAVHRGSFFTEMRTTTCRKLYPEAWGFMCPVHTPDGTPCGLLNHLSEMCVIASHQPSVTALPNVLVSLGMIRLDRVLSIDDYSNCGEVSLDGRVIGFVKYAEAAGIVTELRKLKTSDVPSVPATLEVGYIPPTEAATQYPGIFMFSTPARMMRPVMNLVAGAVELIGTFEQPYLEICIVKEEATKMTTHQELRQTAMLSILAAQVPFPDHNQSPRNMYSCQMGKQTMGIPSHTLKYRSDTKMYGISAVQVPLVRPAIHDHYHLDDYPMGSNAVVAVISYTGYDMEDALILNKASVERGFKHGWIVKTHITNLREVANPGSKSTAMSNSNNDDVRFLFGRPPGWTPGHEVAHGKLDNFVDVDGLPFIGTKVTYGDPLCCYYDVSTEVIKVETHKSTEEAFVADVKVLGSDNGASILQAVAITLYISRSPIIGDKFANRHGQKGVCSFLWPQENMPFSTSGMTPDIIFNPHGYPSRMTIGMMIESLAGKTASSLGTVHDATPFTFNEDFAASDYYGEMLESLGYNYYGTERMYSGVDGRELKADIFVGVLFYIRLRHMVGDKYQVRSTGPIDQMTHQPVKGRKRCGGIRFGEMERDSLLAHGTSFLLHDRLFNCSDRSTAYGCSKCGSLLSTYLMKSEFSSVGEHVYEDSGQETWTCRICDSRNHVKQILVPYVLKYLVAELASVNIKVNFKFD